MMTVITQGDKQQQVRQMQVMEIDSHKTEIWPPKYITTWHILIICCCLEIIALYLSLSVEKLVSLSGKQPCSLTLLDKAEVSA